VVVLQAFIAAGVDVHAADEAALMSASEQSAAPSHRTLCVPALHMNTSTVVHYECAGAIGQADVIRVLLAHGADVHAGDDQALR
jgi:hypothetical protein